jgi:AraC-like DNA-binding protein
MPGSLLIVPAGLPFGYKPAQGRWRFLWYHLSDYEKWARLKSGEATVRKAVLTDVLEHSTLQFLRECRRRDEMSRRAALLHAELVAIYVERELGPHESSDAGSLATKLHRLWDVVNEDLRKPWKVEDLAAAMDMSVPHFYRIVRKYCGCSPMQMVTRLRMEYAQELLVKFDKPIRAVAEHVGYQNEFAFATAFKRFSGGTPGEFRRRR